MATPKSPFLVYENFISPLLCEQIVDNVDVIVPDTDVDGKPTGVDLSNGTTNGNTLTTNENGEWREVSLSGYILLG